jgi:hypothetical protein
VGNNFITTELIFNAERAKVQSEPLWTQLDNELEYFDQDFAETQLGESPTTKPTRFNFVTSEKLRRLSIAYYYAGELDRADILITRALQTPIPPELKPAEPSANPILQSSWEGPVGTRVLILIDAACIRAKQYRFDQANGYLERIFLR